MIAVIDRIVNFDRSLAQERIARMIELGQCQPSEHDHYDDRHQITAAGDQNEEVERAEFNATMAHCLGLCYFLYFACHESLAAPTSRVDSYWRQCYCR